MFTPMSQIKYYTKYIHTYVCLQAFGSRIVPQAISIKKLVQQQNDLFVITTKKNSKGNVNAWTGAKFLLKHHLFYEKRCRISGENAYKRNNTLNSGEVKLSKRTAGHYRDLVGRERRQ